MAEYITHSREETVALGRKLAAVLPDGALIAFTGGLGAEACFYTAGGAQKVSHHRLSRINFTMISSFTHSQFKGGCLCQVI